MTALPRPPVRRCVSLATGRLDILVERSDLPLEQLCGFAARRNPRRAFLFLSRVLGRHFPTRPSVMRDAQTRLANRIPLDLPGPVVFIALAETAIALGQGVHEVWSRRARRDDVLFLHTTRYRLDAPLAFTFDEEHSHAPRHLVYSPAMAADETLFRSARSLVIVDDEATTGTTFVNLARAFAHSGLERVVCVALTDWSPPFTSRMPVETELLTLLDGSYHFTPAGDAHVERMPFAVGNNQPKDRLILRNRGRLGLRAPMAWEGPLPEVRPGERVLVLGTGEFSWLPFLLAERLEAAGVEAWCQTTTRSPLLLGGDVSGCVEFHDNYDDGISNYLYNYDPGKYDRVFLCCETPRALLSSSMLRIVGATPIEM